MNTPDTPKYYAHILRYILLISCILWVKEPVYAQQEISGIVKDDKGVPMEQIRVMLKNSSGSIIQFATTNAQGKYTLTPPDTLKFTATLIEINQLGYQKLQQQLIEGKYVYDFLLTEKVIELKEVVIKSKPYIESKGDTLSYNVSSFAQPEDRSIGDVMGRMPGLTVAEDGRILYNGENILNLLIHDDDLMDGRYGLATKAITKDMIKSIDIIKNHQPIKVLKNKVFTDKVVVNLVLKDENSLKLTGQAMLGSGLPEQFDAAFNTMIFNKKFKMLNTLKANNSGIDFRNDFAQFGNPSRAINNISNPMPRPLLSDGVGGAPDLPHGNYYLNRSGVINANNLVNITPDIQFKTNIQAFVDRNTRNYRSQIDNYLLGDTIRYDERQSSVYRPFILNAAITASVNKNTYFLNNILRFSFDKDDKISRMDFNGNAFNQNLNVRTRYFSNDFNWTPALGRKGILELRWLVNYANNPQRLHIDSGLNSNVLNNGIPYAAINQQASIPTLYSNISATYLIHNRVISQTYQFGMLNETQQLNSSLLLTQPAGNTTAYQGDAGNLLHWQRNEAFVNTSLRMQSGSWEAYISVPATWQFIRYHQDEYALNKRDNQFFILPSARLKFSINSEDYLAANYSYKTNLGDITGIYRGSILTNYRSLYANDAGLQEKHISGSGINYSFQRSIIMLFINAGVNYNKVTANTILSSVLTDNVQRTVLLPYKNDQSAFSAQAGISKYIFALNTTASLNANFNKARYGQFINGAMLPFTNNAFTVNAGIKSKFFRSIDFGYSGTATTSVSKQQSAGALTSGLKNKMKRFDQAVSFGYSPINDLFLNINARHIYSTQPNIGDISYLFLDAKIRYKVARWRTDIEFDVTNLLNVKNYELRHLSFNQSSISQYEIRGSMSMLRATFYL